VTLAKKARPPTNFSRTRLTWTGNSIARWTSLSISTDNAGAKREIVFLPNKAKKCFVFIDGDYGMKDQSSRGSRNLGSGTPDLPGNGLPNAVLLPPVSWVSSTSFLPSRAGERQPY
jgi:hypothetical protein